MKTFTLLFLYLGWIGAMDAQTLTLSRTILLPGVEGRIDHFSLDTNGERLFVAALGNNTVEVVDLKTGNVIRSLGGFSEPQGILYLPEFQRLYVANGGDGTLHIFDGSTFASIAILKFGSDADNLRYDRSAKKIYVGYGSGALGIVDAEQNAIIGNIPLSAHPESFQLETTGTRIFVNVPNAHKISVEDRATKKSLGSWPLGLVMANFPMALDDERHRAFVACRLPARLLVFDTQSGREIAKLDLHGDCDDVFYDAARQQIYASCGEGFIDVFSQADADHYTLKESVKTVSKARTCLFENQHLYLAIPLRGNEPAQIREYVITRAP